MRYLTRVITGMLFLLVIFTVSSFQAFAQERIAPEDWKPVDQPNLAEALENVEQFQLEEVVDGPEICREGRVWWVPNPDGNSWQTVLFYNPGYWGPHEVLIFDFGSGEFKSLNIPEYEAMFHLRPTYLIKDRLFVIPMVRGGGLGLYVYDSEIMDFVSSGIVNKEITAMANEPSIREDGTIFGLGQIGTNQPAIYEIDPDTMHVTVHGPFGPVNPQQRGIYATSVIDGDWFYAKYGQRPWRIIAYNVRTSENSVLAETEPGVVGDHRTISLNRNDEGIVTARVQQPRNDDREEVRYWIHEGQALEYDEGETPWAGHEREEPAHNFNVSTGIANAPTGIDVIRLAPDQNGIAGLRYRFDGEQADIASEWLGPGADPNEWNEFTFEVTFYPANIKRMATLDDGRIFAVTEGYGRAVLMDPVEETREMLGSTMSVYSVLYHEGKVIMGGYSGSTVWIYDPTEPWTANVQDEEGETGEISEDTNPARVARLMNYSDIHRPVAAAGPDAHGNVYFGGWVIRVGQAGGLGWYNLNTGEEGGLRKEFSAHRIYWMCLADDGKYLVVGTKGTVDDYDPEIEGENTLFVIDTETHKVIHAIEFEDQPGQIIEALPGLVMGHSSSGKLYGFHPESGKILWEKQTPVQPVTSRVWVQRNRQHYDFGPDGKIWSSVRGGVIVRIDPLTAEMEILGDSSASRQLVFVDGEVYMGGAPRLRRIVGLGEFLSTANEEN